MNWKNPNPPQPTGADAPGVPNREPTTMDVPPSGGSANPNGLNIPETLTPDEINRANSQCWTDARIKEYHQIYEMAHNPLLRVHSVSGIIGRGRHSVVYEGQLAGPGAKVSIKVDNRNVLEDFSIIDARIKLLHNLDHPNLSKLIGFIPDWENKRSYIIMEYIPGEPLSETLKREQTISQARVLNWAHQILNALEYLHKKSLVHGGIDLSDIIRRWDDNSVCLIDFSMKALGRNPDTGEDYERGEARVEVEEPQDELAAGHQAEEASPPGSGIQAPESVAYPSEEGLSLMRNIISKEDLQRAIQRDIYHVGASLFQLLTGRIPDPSKSRNPNAPILPEEEKRSLLLDRKVSPEIAEIILKAIARNPKDRYQSAAEMREALQNVAVKRRNSEISQIKKRLICAVISAVFLFAAGVGMLRLDAHREKRGAEMRLAEANAVAAMAKGDYTAALKFSLDANGSNPLDPPESPEARKLLADVLGVYRFSEYQPLYSISVYQQPGLSQDCLVSPPIGVRMSPDGSRIAVLTELPPAPENQAAAPEGTPLPPPYAHIQVFETATGKELKHIWEKSGGSPSPRTANSTLKDFFFRDENTLIFAGETALTALDLTSGSVIWQQDTQGPGMPPPDAAGPGMSPPDGAGPDMPPPDAAGPGMSPPDGAGPDMPPPDGVGPGMSPPNEKLLPVSMAISGDTTKLAVLHQDQQHVYLFNTISGERTILSLDLPGTVPEDLSRDVPDSQKEPMDHLLALDETGKYLAASFSDGTLCIYRLENNQIVASFPVQMFYDCCRHFEGGFSGPYFLYAASGIDTNGKFCAESKVIGLDGSGEDGGLNVILQRTEHDVVHAYVDQEAMLLSVGNTIFRPSPKDGIAWKPLNGQLDGDVVFLYHLPTMEDGGKGWILAGSEHAVMLSHDDTRWGTVYNTDSAVSLPTSIGLMGCLSGEYLVLTSLDSSTLSVLKWNSSPIFSYDSGCLHSGFAVTSDGSSAILYRPVDFWIVRPDQAAEWHGWGGADRQKWTQIIRQTYLRGGTPDGPAEDCLLLEFRDGRVECYSVDDGSQLPSDSVPYDLLLSSREEDSTMRFATEHYIVRSKTGGTVEIYDKNGRLIFVPEGQNEGTTPSTRPQVAWKQDFLCGASEYRGYLLLSLRQDGNSDNNETSYSLLLDQNMNKIARLSGSCEVLADGTLFVDNCQGSILQGRVYTQEELMNEARKRIAERSYILTEAIENDGSGMEESEANV